MFGYFKQSEAIKCKELIQAKILTKTERILKSDEFGIKNPEMIRSLAREIVLRNRRAFDHVEQCDAEEVVGNSRKELTEELYKTAREINTAMSVCTLLIEPKLNPPSNSMAQAMEKCLMKHYSNLRRIYPGLEDHMQNVSVCGMKNLKEEITKFMSMVNYKCHSITIVFNGFLSQKNMLLVGKDDEISVDSFSELVISMFKSLSSHMPVSLDIVYTSNCKIIQNEDELVKVDTSEICVLNLSSDDNTVLHYLVKAETLESQSFMAQPHPFNFESQSSFEPEIPGLDYPDGKKQENLTIKPSETSNDNESESLDNETTDICIENAVQD